VTTQTPQAQDRQLGDFAHVDSADAGDLVARLDAMHSLASFRTYKKETFELLWPAPGARLADIGCGTGEDARSLRQLVEPEGSVTGFDLSAAMLDQAGARHGDLPGLSFENAPSDALGAPDASFDGVRADRVLIHVPSPAATLQEMIRVTKPGGRIVISEPDMPACWVASNDYAVTDRIMREIALSCVSPYLPRDLWTMFKDAGLKEVTLTVRAVTAFDPVSVGKILDFTGVITSMMARQLVTEQEVANWSAEFAERGRAGRFAAGVPIMIVAGTKT